MSLAKNYLAERGITEETAKLYGLEFDDRVSSKIATERLGRGWPKGEVNEVIWFPITDSNGNLISWIARVLPTIAQLPKFVCQLRSHGPPFIPKQVWQSKKTTDQPIIITESPIKALPLCQAGALAIGLNGVWMGASKNCAGMIYLRPELHEFKWLGRQIHLAFDADQNSKPDVLQALIRTAFAFYAAGAVVFQLTTWPLEQGKGVDDYLAGKAGTDVAKQRECLSLLLKSARPFWSTLRPFMMPLIEKELATVAMSTAQRSQLCKELAKFLNVRASALEKADDLGASELPLLEKKGRLEETIEPWSEPVNGVQLLQDIFAQVQRFVIVDDSGYVVICLHIVLAYCWELFYKLPILRLKSPVKRCGKSTALDVIEQLVIRPLLTVSLSPAGLYRIIERYHPYIIIDEADSFGQENDELRIIVNGGYERGRPAIRVNKETLEPEFFDTFGCKVLASIGPLHETIEDRSILIDMKRKPRGVEVIELCDVAPAVFVDLRRKLQRWVADNRDRLSSTKLPRPQSLVDRSWNKWRPLLTIAHVIGGVWPQQCLQAASDISGASDEERSIGIEVLFRIRALARQENAEAQQSGKPPVEFLSSEDIITHLNLDKEAPWADWKKGEQKGITTKRLSSILKPFKIKSEEPRIDGKRARGYWLESFKDAFESYLEPEKIDF
jgi:putative DNA primase/helicase